MSKKFVYLFAEGNESMRELLGGKGSEPRRDEQSRHAGALWLYDYNRSL